LAKVQGYSGVLGEENNKSGQKSFITKWKGLSKVMEMRWRDMERIYFYTLWKEGNTVVKQWMIVPGFLMVPLIIQVDGE
jgi:hypothetical protein